MAVPKVCGIETEFGIVARGVEMGPVAASSLLVLAHGSTSESIDWDFGSEHPGADARGFEFGDAGPTGAEPHLVNTVLSNGARFYVDHAHPEYSSPECRDPLELVAWDRAGEEIVRQAMRRAAASMPEGSELVVYKNNSDGKGNSYGCHENYLVDRRVPFSRIVAGATPHLVTRQIFCGSGKVGSESGSAAEFQIAQRPDFIEEEVGLETTIRRPIVNTRDEPHADPSTWRRLHVILGDANLSETATFLKVGTTAIVLSMVEDGEFPDGLDLDDPVLANRSVCADPSLTARVVLRNGASMTALDLQERILSAARSWASARGLESVGGEEVGGRILRAWGDILDSLAGDRSLAARTVDWVAKMRLIDGYCARHGASPSSAEARAIDLQYHDLRPGRGLAAKAGLMSLVDAESVASAIHHPPRTTRAFLRGSVISKWPGAVVSSNWDGVVLDAGEDDTVKIPMTDPLDWTERVASVLVEASSQPIDLVRAIRTRLSADR